MSPETDLESVERRLVWIMGSPRTGSTWLLRLLCYPWGVGRTPTGIDPSRFRPRGGNVIPVNESYLPHHLGPLRDPLPPPETAAEASLLLNDTRGTDPAYFFSEEYRDTWWEPLRRMALERFDAQAQRAAGEHGIVDPLILIKEPNGSHASDLVAGLFGQSRLIFLLRDGRDVVDSMMDADSDGGWRTRTEGVSPLEPKPSGSMGCVARPTCGWCELPRPNAPARYSDPSAHSRSATRSCWPTRRMS